MAGGAWTTSTIPAGAVSLSPGGSRMKAWLVGGPELAAAMARLEKGLRDELLAGAAQAGGDVIAAAWRERAPVGVPPEKVPGAYRDSINARSRPGKNGATAIVAVGNYPGLPASQQPRRYAPRLEFGSSAQTKEQLATGTRQAGRRRRWQPSARPAFDAAQNTAIAAVQRRVLELLAAATP